MRRSLLLAPAVALAAALVPVAAQAAASTVQDPVGDAPAGQDITSVYYTTEGSAIGMSMKVRDLAATGRVRLSWIGFSDYAYQYDVVRTAGGTLGLQCHVVDDSEGTRRTYDHSCEAVDHYSWNRTTDRVAIVVKEGVDFEPTGSPYYLLRGVTVRPGGAAYDVAPQKQLRP